MASSLKSNASGQYVNFDEYIDYQLQKTRSGVKSTDILTALAGAAALLLGYFLTFTAFDHWVVEGGFGPFARWSLFSAVVLATVAWIGWKVLIPYLRSVNRLFAAQLIEKSEPGFKGTLLSLIDLQRTRRPVSEDVRRTLEKRAALGLSRMDVDQAVDRRQLMRTSYVLLAIVLLCCFYTLFSPKRLSFRRAFLPAAEAAAPTRTEILNVQPGDTDALVRTPLQVTAQLSGEIPERVRLLYTTDDRKFVDEPVSMHEVRDGINQYRGTITGENGAGLLQDLGYRIVAGDARTRRFQVRVIEPPSARVTEVRYEYPDYMDLPSRTETSGHIDAWEGTRVTLHARTNMPVTSARMLFSDTEDTSQKAEEIPMDRVDARTLKAQWTLQLRSDGSYPHFYRIACRNDAGQTNPDPTLHHLTIRPDRPPEIELLDPVRDLERPANAVVPLLFQARDPDFLLREVELHATKNGEPLLEETLWEGERPEFGTTHDWDLEPLNLKPGDRVTYWLQARDNKRPAANQKNSPQLNIDIVEAAPEEEVQEQLDADKKRQQESQKSDRQGGSGSKKNGEKNVGAGEQPQHDKRPQPGEKKGSDQQAENQHQEGNQKAGESASESGEGQQGEQQRYSPDGEDDQEVLEKLLRETKQDQQDGQSQEQPSQDQPEKNQPQDRPNENDRTPDGDPNQKQPADSKHPPSGEQNGQKTGADRQPAQSEKDQSEQPQEQTDQSQNGQGADTQSREESRGDGQSPDDASGGAPMPDDSQMPAEQQQPGEGGQKSGDSSSQKGGDRQSSEQPVDGEQKPADPSSDAQREKATGNEQGEATPDHNPNADPTPAQNDLQRKPGEEPARRESKQQSDSAQQAEEGTANPQEAEPAPPGKKPSQDPQADQQPSPPKNVDRPSEKRDGQPDGKNEELQGEGRPQGQKSDQPQGGEAGSSQQADQGTTGSNQEGPGDSGSRGGDEQTAEQSTGQESNGRSGKGAKSGSDNGSKSGGDSAQPGGAGGSGEGQTDGQSGGESSGGGSEGAAQQPGGGAAAGKSGGGGNEAGGGAPNQQGKQGEGGTGGSPPSAEEAHLEDAKEATNLVLKRLDDQLERGEVDRELLEELGWTEEEMQRFVDRLQGQLDGQSDATTPEAEARRRQFEEMLKSLDLESGAARRSGAEVENRSSQEGISSRRMPVPAEYREMFDAYTRSLSRRTAGSGDDSGPDE